MSNHSYFSGLLKKNLWIYFFSFLIAPAGYIVKIVMTGTLSQEDYGIFVAVISFVMILGAYNDFGMADSLNFFLPEHIHKKNKIKITQTLSIALVTQIFSSSILAIILYFFADFLALYYFKAPSSGVILHIFIVFFFVDNIFRSINVFFQSLQDTKLQKLTDFLRNFFQLILIIGVAFFGGANVVNYAWAYNGSALLWVLISLIFLYSKYHSYFTIHGWYFWRSDFYNIFKYAIFVMLSANVATLLGQIDTQLIVIMLGTTEAWIYNIYLAIMRIPFLLLFPGVYFLFPVFSDLLKRWDIEKVQTIYTFCYELFSIIALMTMSFFMLFWDVLTTVLFWSGYELSGKILLYSSPFLIFNFLLQIDFQILNSSWRPRTKMLILLYAVGVNLITNYIFLKIWGIAGSAVASGIGWIFIWTLSFKETKHFAHNFRWAIFWKNALWIIILSGILMVVHLENFFSGRIQLFFWLTLVGCLYWATFVILNFWEFLRIKKLFHNNEIIW